MTKDELNAYYRYLDNIVILRNNIFTAREEGRMEGRVEAERLKQLEIARNMKKAGTNDTVIAQVTEMTEEEMKNL